MDSAFGYARTPTADAGAAQEAVVAQPEKDSALHYTAAPTYAEAPTHKAAPSSAASPNYTAAVSSGRRGAVESAQSAALPLLTWRTVNRRTSVDLDVSTWRTVDRRTRQAVDLETVD